MIWNLTVAPKVLNRAGEYAFAILFRVGEGVGD
jgi:hypothetical protein